MAVIYALLRVRLNNVQNVFVHQKINHRRNRHYFSANGPFLLLPLALKWGLLSLLAMVIVPCINAKGVSAASLTLEIPTTPLTLDISPSENGTFSKSSPATIKVSTNALAGYSLSIKAKNGSDLINTSTNDKIVSITGDVAENIFNTSSDYNNKYGFAFGKSETLNTANNTFHSGVNTAIATTDEPNTENNAYDIVLGARVSNTIAAVQYSNTFVVMASANPVPYRVSYSPNASSDQVTNMPSDNSGQTDTETFTITDQQPTRAGYRFIGWCDGTTESETNVDICSNGIPYQPKDTYTLKEKSQDVTLFAMWAPNSQIMQNWKGCNDLQESTAKDSHEITLIDTRDNKPYYVAKLADGNCWMTENLDLDIDQNKTYTATDTDLGYASDDGKNGGGDGNGKYTWKPDKSTHSTGDTTWNMAHNDGPTSQSGNGDTIQQSYDPGNFCWKGPIEASGESGAEWFHQHTIECNKHEKATGSDPHYSLGNYYNYGAAVAQNDTSAKTSEGDYYYTSICPAGWQLPTKDGDKSYNNLFTQAKDKGTELKSGASGNIQDAPYWFNYSGYWGGSFSPYAAVGFGAVYHSGTIVSNIASYNMVYRGNDYLTQSNHGWRLHGFSVRCVAR